MNTFTKPKLTTATAQEAVKFAESKSPRLTTAADRRAFNAPDGYRRLTINLPEELHKRLRLAAVEDDRTATEIIEGLLEQHLASRAGKDAATQR